MNRTTELTTRLEAINKKIYELETEKQLIIQELATNVDTSLTERFYLWCDNADVELEYFQYLGDKCPVLAEYIDSLARTGLQFDQRHRTYDLTEYFIEELEPIFTATDEERASMMVSMKDYELWFTIGLELMRENVKSFTFDW